MRDLLLSIFVDIEECYSVTSENETVCMVNFSGCADSPFFKGIICPGGVDTQIQSKGGPLSLSARYILKGKDLTGQDCSIFIENNAAIVSDKNLTKPKIITNSKALSWLQYACLEGEVNGLTANKIRIDIYETLLDYSIHKFYISTGGKKIYSELYLPLNKSKVTISDETTANAENEISAQATGDIEFSCSNMPILICSHGFNSNTDGLANELKHIAARGIPCLAYDFCGGSNYSKSSGLTTEMSIESEMADLRDVFEYVYQLDFVDRDRIFLFGSSQGGFVTGLTVPQLSDRIKGIFLEYPAFCIPEDWKNKIHEIKEDVFDFWGVKLGQAFLKGLPQYDVFECAGQYRGNVCLFHGTADSVVAIEYSNRLCASYNSCSFFKYPEQGHGFSDTFLTAMAGQITKEVMYRTIY